MPQLSKDHKPLDLKAARKARGAQVADPEEEAIGRKNPAASRAAAPQRPKASHKLLSEEDYDDPDDIDEESEEGDEIIAASVKNRKEGGDKTIKVVGIGAIVVVVIVILFLIFGRSRNSIPTPQNPDTTPAQTEQAPPASDDQGPTEIPDDPLVGTQDFRGDTNMTSDTGLSDPEDFIKDIYGLTLRVDYTVSKIQTASDFVNYEKRRGTWGGGLELYWLDCEYKNNHYVVQVPFQYYKELDDTGIVPVKMEVLRILSETDGTYLSVISYMCLDEKTLESVLKTQTKK